MFKAIHGIAPHYLSDCIDMYFDIHGYDTNERLSSCCPQRDIQKYFFFYIRVVNFGMNCQIL